MNLHAPTDLRPIGWVIFYASLWTLPMWAQPTFYMPPSAPAIFTPEETIATLEVADTDAESLQKRIDEKAVTKEAGATPAPLVIRIRGTVTVKDQPLKLPEGACLIFEGNGGMAAAGGAAAKELLLLDSVNLVGIRGSGGASGFLRGGGSVETAITVTRGGRIALNALHFRNLKATALQIAGPGDDRYARAVSLTRSTFESCGDGVRVSASPQFIALDNRFQNLAGVAMDLASPGAIAAGNLFDRCRIALAAASKDLIATSNVFQNCALGVDLRDRSELAFLEGNRFLKNTKAVAVDGMRNTLHANVLAGPGQGPQVSVAGKENALMGNAGFSPEECLAPGNTFFHPPTLADRHRWPVIYQGPRDTAPLGRFDLTIEGGKEKPVDVSEAMRLLEEARSAHPRDVLVATLKGRFETTTKEGLKVPDNTCLLLDGEVRNGAPADATNQAGFEPRTSLIALQGKGCASLSGGRLFSDTAVLDAVTTENAENAVIVHGTAIDLSSPHAKTGARSRNAITSKKHRGPMIVAGNDIRDSGQRGVWGHVTSRLYVVGNTFTRSGMVMDFDAFCTHSAALYNGFSGTTYHSAIFMEEAVKFNTAFANRCLSNIGGLHVWNQEVGGSTAMNTIACNTLDGNGINLGVGGRTTNMTASDNFLFNNRILNSPGRSGVNLKGFSSNNYYAQFVFSGNATNVVDMTRKPAAPWFDGRNHVIFTMP